MNSILPSGLIVSCQAEGNSPFAAPEFIAAFARAAELGGAVAVRIRDAVNVEKVRSAVTLPIIGLTKSTYPTGEPLITPSEQDIRALKDAGADVVALDATHRKREDGRTGLQVLVEAAAEGIIPLMADISSEEEAIEAARSGAAFVATTRSVYATGKRKVRTDGPDLELIEALRGKLSVPLIAEGNFRTPEQAALALRLGAHAVVVGTAITQPVEIVKRFVASLSSIPRDR